MEKMFLAAALAIIMLSVGICSAKEVLSPEEIRKLMIDSVNSQTYRFTLEANISQETTDLSKPNMVRVNETSLSGYGAMNITGRAMTMNMDATEKGKESSLQSTKIYAMNDTMYLRQNDAWSKLAISSPGELWSDQKILERQEDLVDKARIIMDGSDEIEGDDCYRLKVVPDSDTDALLLARQTSPLLGASFPSMNASNLFQKVSDNSEVFDWTVWISKESHLLRKSSIRAQTVLTPEIISTLMQLNISTSLKMRIDAIIFYRDYNARTNIILPDEAFEASSTAGQPIESTGISGISTDKELGDNQLGDRMPSASDKGCDWSGTWNSNWGQMEIEQSGDTLTGTFAHDDGRLQGTIFDDMFMGTWTEAPSRSPPDDAGDVELTLSDDCKTFSGNWRGGSSGGWDGDWVGTRPDLG